MTVHPLALRGPLAAVPGPQAVPDRPRRPRLTVGAALRAGAAPDAGAGRDRRPACGTALAAAGALPVEVDVALVDRIDGGRDAAGKLRVIESRGMAEAAGSSLAGGPARRAVRQPSTTRPVAWLSARALHRVDLLAYRLTRGRTTFSSCVSGLPVVMLTTTGARDRPAPDAAGARASPTATGSW